ncbi:hypothetical protein D3C81_2012970 [compost metagenome]
MNLLDTDYPLVQAALDELAGQEVQVHFKLRERDLQPIDEAAYISLSEKRVPVHVFTTPQKKFMPISRARYRQVPCGPIMSIRTGKLFDHVPLPGQGI